VAEGVFNHCLVTENIIESRITTSNKGIGYLFPLFLYPTLNSPSSLHLEEKEPRANIHPRIYSGISEIMGTTPKPEQILQYCYAILFCTNYREKYAEGLKIDFPRIPFTVHQHLFQEMAEKGKELIALHLMKWVPDCLTSPKFEIKGSNRVKHIGFNSQCRQLFINKDQYFSNIDQEIFQYKMAGYPVIHKWLKSRKNKKLSITDIEHVIRLVHIIHATIRCQKEIDAIYPEIEARVIKIKT
jgi:predicted helicase